MLLPRDLQSERLPDGEVASREAGRARSWNVLQAALQALLESVFPRLTVAWPSLFAALALLLAGSTAAAGAGRNTSDALEARMSIGVGEETRQQHAHAAFCEGPEYESSAIAEEVEEAEAETASASNQFIDLAVATCPSREVTSIRSSHRAIGLEEWLREHHAPRGPPLV